MSLCSDFDCHQPMAHHSNMISSANSSSLHSPMGQLQMMPAGLNLSMNSNQGMQAIMTNTSHNNNNTGQNVMHCNDAYGINVGCRNMYGNIGKSKAKKPKVNKDGIPAPKRATTAYINFTQWYREEIKKSGRQIPKIGDFGKECANKWNSMKEEEKQPFVNVAAKDRERYKTEMAIYKPARDVNKPKRPGTAFMLFMSDFRKEMCGKAPEGGVAALAKLGGERWRNMTEEGKRPYIEKQNEEKIRYEQSMEEYRRKQTIEGVPSNKQPRILDEQLTNSTDGSDGSLSSSVSQTTPTSGESTSSSTSVGATSPSQAMSPSPQSPPAAPTSTPTILNMSAPSLTTSMTLTHNNPTIHSGSLGMNYSDHSFPNYAHSAGVLASLPNYNQAHVQSTIASSYLPSNSSNYTQAHLSGHYNWPCE